MISGITLIVHILTALLDPPVPLARQARQVRQEPPVPLALPVQQVLPALPDPPVQRGLPEDIPQAQMAPRALPAQQVLTALPDLPGPSYIHN